MKIIEVFNTPATIEGASVQVRPGVWQGAKPELIEPMNVKEWWYHTVRKKHISYGQPYCVICGKKEKRRPLNGKMS